MKQQINLYQGSLRREMPAFSAAAMSVALAVCALGLAATSALAKRNAGTLKLALSQVQEQEAAASARLQSLTESLGQRGDSEDASDNLRDALAALARRERLLKLIDGTDAGSGRGFSESMAELAAHSVNGLWLTRIQIWAPDMRTTLEGRAQAPSLVPEYLLGLSAEGALDGQRFDQFEIEQSDDSSVSVRFSMTSEQAQRFAAEGGSQ